MPKIIAVEGINRIGKSSIIQLALTLIKKEGYNPIYVSELAHDLGKYVVEYLSENPDTDPYADALLFAAARRQALRNIWTEDATFVFDRYTWSSLAYHGQECGVEYVQQINRFAPPPTKVILLDADPKKITKRKSNSTLSGKYWHDLEFQKTLRSGFLALAEGAEGRAVVLDADRDLELVAEEVTEIIKAEMDVQ